ncbi:unnamed protein product [Pedinophyceae sp. YPF-701]|nr:unnamed protein product [Pedinophyceae sp. YPF-701]
MPTTCSQHGVRTPLRQGRALSSAPRTPAGQRSVRRGALQTTTAVDAKIATASAESLKALKAERAAKYQHLSDSKLSIMAIGLTVHNAPVELRERLATPEAEWPRAIEELTSFPHIEEAAVLSTCNRMEVYVMAHSFHRGALEVQQWMSKISGVPLDELRPHLFMLRDQDATWHLLNVAGGLDSLVMGEGQILAQCKAVYKVGQEAKGFGRHLNGLFKQAITAGKRVRSETSISTGGVSVSSAAAELAKLKLPTGDFNDARCCIIGAGKMSTLLVKHMTSKGCKKFTILNRSLPRAEALRDDFPEAEFEICLMDQLMEVVARSDVVFAASSSETLLLTKDDVAQMPACPDVVGGTRRFVDISVPRNIDPEIGTALGDAAAVYNVDDLKEVVAANKEERAKAAAEAQVLLREEQAAFEAWRDSLETVPTIKALRQYAETLRSSELDKAVNKLGDGLTKRQMKAVEELSRGIVNKLLHGPMTALRCDSSDPEAVAQTLQSMEALERMFSLDKEQA